MQANTMLSFNTQFKPFSTDLFGLELEFGSSLVSFSAVFLTSLRALTLVIQLFLKNLC